MQSWDSYVGALRAALKDYEKLLPLFAGLEAALRAELTALDTMETERRNTCGSALTGTAELIEPDKYYAANGCSANTLAGTYWADFSTKYATKYKIQEEEKAAKAEAVRVAAETKQKADDEQRQKLADERAAALAKLRSEKLASHACKVAQARYELCAVIYSHAEMVRAIAYQKRLNKESGTVNLATLRQLTANRLAYEDMIVAKRKTVDQLKAKAPKDCDAATGVAQQKSEQDSACLID
jgi:hypothetical protein